MSKTVMEQLRELPSDLSYADKKDINIKNIPLTNADKIRSMSDEELAEFISETHDEEIGKFLGNITTCDNNVKSIFEWLQKRGRSMRYKKKPVEVAAIQFDGLNLEEIKSFVGDKLHYDIIDSAWQVGKGAPHILMYIKTLEGDMNVSKYDYIIKGVKGEFYPCKPDIFEKTYELVDKL